MDLALLLLLWLLHLHPSAFCQHKHIYQCIYITHLDGIQTDGDTNPQGSLKSAGKQAGTMHMTLVKFCQILQSV